ncbi:MAG: chemotaxis protein CheW [Cyanobacteria bacterium REEB65]|nr:chemotaxis protein CheW [Cyanobacteria bacterium REEB65]
MSGDEIQFVTFALATEAYAIGISDVQEIIPLLPIIRIPEAPPWVEGLVDLRGTILPVLDLRLRFGMPPADDEVGRCIIVATIEGQPVGLMVDAVREVARIHRTHITPVPPATGIRARFLAGIARIPEGSEHRLLLLLELASLLSSEEVEELASFA